MAIGLKIKELASKKNITLADLAKKLNKTKQAVYEIVEKEDVNTAIIRQCAEIFGVPVSYFFDEIEKMPGDVQEKLDRALKEVERLKKEIEELRKGHIGSRKVIVELDVSDDEFVRMGLKEKVIQIMDR